MEMNLKHSLAEMMRYDLWANREWLVAAENAGLSDILDHILGSQRIWLDRCTGSEFDKMLNETLAVRLEAVHVAWLRYMEELPLDTEIRYTLRNGDSGISQVADIVRHVVNHGSYHRGDMRGRCELLGKDFPETDFIRYKRLEI